MIGYRHVQTIAILEFLLVSFDFFATSPPNLPTMSKQSGRYCLLPLLHQHTIIIIIITTLKLITLVYISLCQ